MADGYRIDTKVIAELRRRVPEPRVVHGLEQRPAGPLYLSVLTLGEIRRGVEMLQQGERKRALRLWLEQELPTFFAGRCRSMGLWPIAGVIGWRRWEGLCQRSTACWRPRHWSTTRC